MVDAVSKIDKFVLNDQERLVLALSLDHYEALLQRRNKISQQPAIKAVYEGELKIIRRLRELSEK